MKNTLKYFLIAAICGLLLIPVFFISQLVSEKQERSNEAVDEVANKWGGSQLIAGPYISAQQTNLKRNNISETQSVFLFPKTFSSNSEIICTNKHRGIYKIDLFAAKIKLNGSFDSTEYESIKGNNLVNVNLFVSDLKGLVSDVKIKIDNIKYEFSTGIIQNDIGNTGIHFAVNYNLIKGKSYEIEFELNGSNSISFVPIGKSNDIKLKGNWPNPSFAGSFLPNNHQITSKDFNAEWKILALNKSFPQKGKERFVYFSNLNYDVSNLYNGHYCMTKIFNPVTDYTKARRANQYAFFLLIIVFIALFLAEFISKSNIHLIQYSIIGSAIVLFYLFLLALSEHLGFNIGYLLSVIMVVLPTFFYTKSILNSVKTATYLSGLTLLLYSMFFIMLLSQDYSLLIGSVLAFIILICVMYITKNFNNQNEKV